MRIQTTKILAVNLWFHQISVSVMGERFTPAPPASGSLVASIDFIHLEGLSSDPSQI